MKTSSIERFEEGLKLVKACRTRLEAAELKVKDLMEEQAGEEGGKGHGEQSG